MIMLNNELKECVNFQISRDQESLNEKIDLIFKDKKIEKSIDISSYIKEKDLYFTRMLKDNIKYTWAEINCLLKDTNNQAKKEILENLRQNFEAYIDKLIEQYLSHRDDFLKENNIIYTGINYNAEVFITGIEGYKKRMFKQNELEMRLVFLKNKIKKSPIDLINQVISNLIALMALIIAVLTLLLTVNNK